MRAHRICLGLALLLLASSSCAALSDDTDTIIVKLTDDMADAQSDDFSVTAAAAAGAAAELGRPIGRRLRRLRRNSAESLDQQLMRVRGMAGVAYAVPDQRIFPAAVRPDDAAVPQQQQPSSRTAFRYQWGAVRVGMPSAWSIATGAESKEGAVTVCVVDSGVDSKHPGLEANLAAGVGLNAVDGEDERDMRDHLGHGTTMAGVVAASGAGGGIVGINYNNINLLSCKFMSAAGWGKTSDAVQCLDYCMEQGARIISASWTVGTEDNPVLDEAVGRADAAGVLVVVAAGNFGQNMRNAPYYPQVYSEKFENVLVVAATDEYDEHAGFSNFDPRTVHLSAPGTMIYTTVPGGGYNFTSGTSISTPFVSGAAALLQAVAQDKLGRTLSAGELKQRLMESAEVLPALRGKTATGGRLRVDWALQLLLGKPLAPPTPCIARPGDKREKCGGGEGGGRLPARRAARETAGAGKGAGEGGQQQQQQQQQQHLARPTRSAGMQREFLRQREQQRSHQMQPAKPAVGGAAAAAAAGSSRRSTRRLHSAAAPIL